MIPPSHVSPAEVTDRVALFGAWLAVAGSWIQWLPEIAAFLASVAACVWYVIRIRIMLKHGKDLG